MPVRRASKPDQTVAAGRKGGCRGGGWQGKPEETGEEEEEEE